MTFPEFHRAGSNSCYSGKGRDAEIRERQSRKQQSRNNSAGLGQSPVLPQGINCTNIFELDEAEAPLLWPPDEKSPLTGKDPDAGKDWRQEEKGTTEDEIVRWHQGLGGHEVKQTLGDGEGQGTLACCSPWVEKSWTHDWATEQQQLLLPVEAFFSPERRSQFENLKNHRNSSVDHLKPD